MKVTREDMQLYAVTDTQWLNGRDFYEEIEANKWELSHGGISGRTAQQFINHCLGMRK